MRVNCGETQNKERLNCEYAVLYTKSLIYYR